MTFRIELSVEPVDDGDGNPYGVVGRIALGSFVERFISSTRFWQIPEYTAQWRTGIRRILDGATSSCLVTDLPSLVTGEFGTWWPMYREGDDVIFRNGLFVVGKRGFSATDPYAAVMPRGREARGPDAPSEWVVPLESLGEFLKQGLEPPLSFELPRPWEPPE